MKEKWQKNGRNWLGLWMALFMVCLFPQICAKADFQKTTVKNNFTKVLIYSGKYADPVTEPWVFDVNNLVKMKKVTVSSSQKSVVTVKKLTDNTGAFGGTAGETACWCLQAEPRKAGTSKITIECTNARGKKVTYKGTIKVVKFVNPFKTLKIDGKSYLSKIKGDNCDIKVKSKAKKFKLNFKLKSGWKLIGTPKFEYFSDSGYKSVGAFKNGKTYKLNKGDTYVALDLKNSKTKAVEKIYITVTR